MPTLPYMKGFANMMVHIAKLNHLEGSNAQLERRLNHQIEEHRRFKRGESLSQLRQKLEEKKRLIGLKRERIAQVS
jgi:hypothetical protein